ncbi:hypothetical protein [Bacillus sp. ISL-45]|uniref:hypothetical protein n=1 Tax=Bacillus sp. ISL-45 TaxID=2819128 RepID=UPI001BEB954B|nr:hypothetical protein [Bacillus sp. ISL-45]MBT2661954.1 hypothetical protein [Bacillus sp. ISL-45]
MAKQKYWDGDSWEVIGTDAAKVDIVDAGNRFVATTVEGALQEIKEPLRVYKSGKDANGIFTVVELKRKSDGTLAVKSTLSGGTSPKYTTRTVVYYAANGTTTMKTDTFTLSYDADGVLVSEV